MPSLATTLLGPLSLILSHYHRKYVWHLDDPAKNPYLYVHNLAEETAPTSAPEPLMSPAANFTTPVANSTTMAMPTPSLFEMPKPAYFMWLFGMFLGIFMASIFFAARQTQNIPDGDRPQNIDDLEKSNATILGRFKALLADNKILRASKNGFQKLAEEFQAHVDEFVDLIKVQADHIQNLYRQIEKMPELIVEPAVKTVKEAALEGFKEITAYYESLRRNDKAEIQRLKDENDRKDRDHKDENDRKDRDHAEQIGRMEQQLRDSEQGRKDAEQSRDQSEQKRKDAEQKQSDAAKEHQAQLDRVNRDHNAEMEKATSENNTKLESVRTECDATIATMKAAHAEEIGAMAQKVDAANKSTSELKVAHAKEIDAMTHKVDAANKSISELKVAHDTEIGGITQKLEAANKKISEVKEAHGKEIGDMAQTLETANGHANDLLKTIETMTANHDSEVTRIRSEHKKEIEGISASQGAAVDDAVKALRAEHELELAKIEEFHDGDLFDLRDDHATDMAAKETEMKAGHEAAIEKLRKDHEAIVAEMQAQDSALRASHGEEISSLHDSWFKKVKQIAGELDDSQQARKRQSQQIVDLESASAEHAALQEEVAELKAALEFAQANPEAADKKKRPRKNRGVDAKAKGVESMSAEDRRQYISQEVGRRSQNGLIRFMDIDWAAVTDGLEGWNGAMIASLIDEAKMVAKAEADTQGDPQRGNAVTQADFAAAISNVDAAGRAVIVRTAEETAASSARPLPWHIRRNLFETYLALHEFGQRSQDIDWDHVNEMTIGFNGAEVQRVIKVIINEKAVGADEPTSSAQTHETMITQADLESTIVQHKAGLAKYEDKDPAEENDTGDRAGDTPSEPGSNTPARQANPQPPPGDPSIRAGHGVYTPPHRLPRPN